MHLNAEKDYDKQELESMESHSQDKIVIVQSIIFQESRGINRGGVAVGKFQEIKLHDCTRKV